MMRTIRRSSTAAPCLTGGVRSGRGRTRIAERSPACDPQRASWESSR